MKIIKYLLLSLVLMSLLFVSCTGNRMEAGVATPFYGGSEGLIAEFEDVGSLMSQSGYPEIWEDQGIPIQVRIYNRGEFTLPSNSVQFTIKGIKIPEDFQGAEAMKTNTNEIEKVSEYLTEGGDELVDFGEAYYVKGVKGTFYIICFTKINKFISTLC